MEKNKSLTINEIFNLAIKNHQEGKTDIAQELYNQILEIDPRHSPARNNLGVLFQELGEHQKTKECYEKAIEIDPNYAEAHNNLGAILKELGENQQAKECYEKAIEIDPNYADAHYNLGGIFRDLSEHQKAKECYEKAIEIDPNHINAHNNLGTILKDLGEHQKAKDCFEKVIEVNPNHINAHNNLGLLFRELREHQKAKDCFEKVIEVNPNHVNAHYNLGGIFRDLSENQKAKSCYEKAIEIDPNYVNLINSLSDIFFLYQFDFKSETDKNNFKELLLLLFRKDNNKYSNIDINAKLLLLTDSVQNQFLKDINSERLLENKILQDLMKEELFHLMLQKAIMSDEFLEKLLAQLRCEILFTLHDANKDILKEHFNFIISLAEQCWLNEYLYTDSEKEINQIIKLIDKIKNDNSVNELEIAILGCYIPLNKSKIIIEKLFNYKSTNILFNDLINVQIKEPLKEKELARSIKSLDIIKDPVSKKVQEQYEENPYPRWRFTSKILSKNFFSSLNIEIAPNKINYNNKFDNPNVLIAGCGTGRHSISANRFKNANILAVDLSKSSLAYAKRKTEELGFKNIEYLHADILQLKKLNKKFDIIESSGVLHHMKEPITGLKMLLDILEPHGFLKIGLYSEIARRNITEIRKFIKNKNYKGTNKDILACRQDILDKKVDPLIQKVTAYLDFYSTSMTRDLLFHVQEHQFTIPQISKILKDLNLEFLGFFFLNPLVKKKFSKLFPEDKNNVSLDNWHQFEINNPDIFIGMYQFWLRKI